MSYLIRWKPNRNRMTRRNAFDRFFEYPTFNTRNDWFRGSGWDFALDVAETDEDFIIEASIPGIEPEKIEVTFSNNVVTVKGDMEEEDEVEEKQYHLRERRVGSFQRSVTLPEKVNVDESEATYEAGILKLRLPKVEEAKPKKIKVHSQEKPQMIEGKVKDA